MLRGHDPSLSRASDICAALGIQLRIGRIRPDDDATESWVLIPIGQYRRLVANVEALVRVRAEIAQTSSILLASDHEDEKLD